MNSDCEKCGHIGDVESVNGAMRCVRCVADMIDDVRRERDASRTEVTILRNAREGYVSDRDHWRKRAIEAETRATAAEEKLSELGGHVAAERMALGDTRTDRDHWRRLANCAIPHSRAWKRLAKDLRYRLAGCADANHRHKMDLYEAEKRAAKAEYRATAAEHRVSELKIERDVRNQRARFKESKNPALTEKTLRDEFAMAAMRPMLAWDEDEVPRLDVVAADAYLVADAMMEARKR